MKYYECHITIQGNPSEVKEIVDKTKWKFSAIDGDANLGDGIKCYATRQIPAKFTSEQVLEQLMKTAQFLEEGGLKLLRRKVELVIFDDKSSKVQCLGNCVECHLDDYLEIRGHNEF